MGDESDEDVFDNWEDLVDSVAFEKRLKKMKSPAASDQTTDVDRFPELRSSSSLGPVIFNEEIPRTPYAPPEPQVKILKRPANASKVDGVLVNGEKFCKQPIKTLQQREAEYAEARLRILGAAKSEEEIAAERIGKLSLAPLSDDTKLVEAVPIIRQPYGPDGTRGFAAKR